jgi:hypothetical protein
LDRLRLENKKEWNMSHLLSLIINEETTIKIGDGLCRPVFVRSPTLISYV